MKFSEFSVKNSLLIHLISAFVILAGIISLFQLHREVLPDIPFNVITIRTVYPGATPEDVEKLVTIPLEKEIKVVSGIKEMASSSDEGLSVIDIKLEPDLKDTTKAYAEIRQAVGRYKDLPEEAEEPQVTEINSKEIPLLGIAISGEVSEQQKRKYAQSLEDQLLEIPGVANVQRFGWRDREFQVELNPAKLQEYYVSMDEVVAALRARNVTIPAGKIILADNEFYIRSNSEFRTPQEMEEVVIRANDSGYGVKIKDVARVVDTFADETLITKINGKRAVSMVVIKRESSDTLKVAQKIRETVAEFRQHLPEGIEVTVTNDFSYYLIRRLDVIKGDCYIGFFIILLILFLFMDPLPAFLTASGIPFTLFTTFAVMNLFGISINVVTMLGLIIVLGMMIDEEIVVAENVYRYMEEGMSPHEATIKGTNDVAGSVFVTILTAWAAFAPLLFMSDVVGKFVQYIPLIVVIALGASLLEAIFVLPSHLAEFIKADRFLRQKSEKKRKWLYDLTSFYSKWLKKAVEHRYRVVGGVAVLFVFTILLAVFHMKIILFTGEGIENFFIRAEAPIGISLQKMDELTRQVEQMISTEIPKNELSSFRTYVGAIEEEGGWDPYARRGSHLAQIMVFLTPLQERKRTPNEIMDSLRPKLAKIPGFERLYFYKTNDGPPVGRPVSVAIKGDDFAVLDKIATRFKETLQGIKGVNDISSSYDYGKRHLQIVTDEEKAKELNLSIDAIARTLRNAYRGRVATSIKPSRAEKEIDVVVRFPEGERSQMESFDKILIANQMGKLIPLKSVVRIEETQGVYLINHLDGKRVIWVTADVDNKYATSLSVNQRLQKKFKDITKENPGCYVKYGGEFEDQRESMLGLLMSFGLAIFCIFIIMAAMFKSVLQPLIVMLAIPFGIIGIILAFWAHGRPLSFFALMGLVGLTGIVVNDSVVLVEFINKLRRKGKSRLESILESGRLRFRPVLMTALTTISGLITVAYDFYAGGDPFLKPLALAMVWGLMFAFPLTLLVIPCIYAIIDDVVMKFAPAPSGAPASERLCADSQHSQ